MSHTITRPPVTKNPAVVRIVGRWMVSFIGFPLGGLAAIVLTDPVDSIGHAVAGGLVTGTVLGAVQAWALRFTRRQLLAWTLATAIGLAAGLALGASLVSFSTDIADLALQGAVTGAFVGAAQAGTLLWRTGPVAVVWPFYLAAVYALGWVVTTAGGIAVEEQLTTFGALGAVTATFLTAVLPAFLATGRARPEKST